MLHLLAPPDRVAILGFHRVLTEVDQFRVGEPDIKAFECQVKYLARYWRCLPLHEVAEAWHNGTSLPRGSVVLTFDDGYLDNLTLAAPILQKYGVPATVFVASGVLEAGIMWNDRLIEAFRSTGCSELDLTVGDQRLQFRWDNLAERVRSCMAVVQAVKRLQPERRAAVVDQVLDALGISEQPRLMLQPDQVRDLADVGLDVGGHTVNHPVLSHIDASSARAEVVDGKRRLEEWTGAPVRTFAYPNGRPGEDYGPEHVAMVRDAGFRCAVTTEWAAARASNSLYELPRCGLGRDDFLRASRRMFANFWG